LAGCKEGGHARARVARADRVVAAFAAQRFAAARTEMTHMEAAILSDTCSSQLWGSLVHDYRPLVHRGRASHSKLDPNRAVTTLKFQKGTVAALINFDDADKVSDVFFRRPTPPAPRSTPACPPRQP